MKIYLSIYSYLQKIPYLITLIFPLLIELSNTTGTESKSTGASRTGSSGRGTGSSGRGTGSSGRGTGSSGRTGFISSISTCFRKKGIVNYSRRKYYCYHQNTK